MKEYTAFEINCDDCDKGLYDPLSDYGSIFRSDDEAKIACHHQLWEVHGDHHICPDCQTKSKDESKKQLEPYEQRMVDEYTALKTRIDSITSFLRNEDSRSDIGLGEFRLLIEQYCSMLEYADALKKRLELHSINVEAIKEMMPV